MCGAMFCEDEWLDSLMGRCMIEKDVKDKPSGVSCGLFYTSWPGYTPQTEAGLESSNKFKQVFAQVEVKPKAPVQVPPWLRMRTRPREQWDP